MSSEKITFDDPIVDRKLTMQLGRAGFGIHPERGVFYLPLADQITCSDEYLAYIKDRAIIQYEVDFILASFTDTIEAETLLKEDNVYILPNINEEQHHFLEHKAKMSLTPEAFEKSDKKELTKRVEKAFRVENFTRNEFTKPAVFKVGFTQQAKK